MATAAQTFAALRRLNPEDALAYLRDRNLITQTWSWADLQAEEHAHQFTVSRLASVDLLMDMRALITASVEGDLSRTDFMRDAREALAKKGWWGIKTVTDPATGEQVSTTFNPTRLKLIYETNIRQAAMAAQWERAQATKRLFPYLRYVTLDDDKVRHEHKAWHNRVLPIDDPWWLTHYPPNAYRCRCYVRQVSQSDYDRGTTPTGQRMDKTAPPENLREWVNPRTGETLMVPEGVHPGFVGNAGTARAQALQRAAADKLQAAAPELASRMAADLARSPAFERWMQSPAGSWPLVRLPQQDASAMGARTSVAQLSAQTMEKQARVHPELTAEDYAQAQQVVDGYTHKLQDSERTMVYLRDRTEGHAGGTVLVVKATKTGSGLFVTSLRRLSSQEAKRDAEVQRLLARGEKK